MMVHPCKYWSWSASVIVLGSVARLVSIDGLGEVVVNSTIDNIPFYAPLLAPIFLHSAYITSIYEPRASTRSWGMVDDDDRRQTLHGNRSRAGGSCARDRGSAALGSSSGLIKRRKGNRRRIIHEREA